MPDETPDKDPLSHLPENLVDGLRDKPEQLVFAIGALTSGQTFVAAHHERIVGEEGQVERVTALTDKALFQVEVDRVEKRWTGGNLLDEQIRVRAWRLADLREVTPSIIHLHQTPGKFVETRFERVDVRVAGSEDVLQIPGTTHPDDILASEDLRNGIWRAWIEGPSTV